MDLIIVGPILDLIDFKILLSKIKPALCKNVCSNGSKRGGPFSYETLQTSYFFLSLWKRKWTKELSNQFWGPKYCK